MLLRNRAIWNRERPTLDEMNPKLGNFSLIKFKGKEASETCSQICVAKSLRNSFGIWALALEWQTLVLWTWHDFGLKRGLFFWNLSPATRRQSL
jgi:hypothetical protein